MSGWGQVKSGVDEGVLDGEVVGVIDGEVVAVGVTVGGGGWVAVGAGGGVRVAGMGMMTLAMDTAVAVGATRSTGIQATAHANTIIKGQPFTSATNVLKHFIIFFISLWDGKVKTCTVRGIVSLS